MEAVALLPGIAAVIVMLRRSHREAYVDVYLLSILVLPAWCRLVLPGLPDPTFNETAAIPIALAFLLTGARNWKWSPADLLVLAFAAVIGYSEYRNAGFSEAQNLMFDMVAAAVLPYVMAKGIVEPNGLRLRFLRRFILLQVVVVGAMAYEFRFGHSPFRTLLDPFFRGQGAGWVTTFRYGVARAAGPYGHAILAGVILMIGFRLQRWLENSGGWDGALSWLPLGPKGKARLVTVILLGGLVITFARGPWLGAVLAAAITAIGAGANPRKRGLMLLAGLVLGGTLLGVGLSRYTAGGRIGAKTESQETAAYRKELVDKYVGIALDRSAFGWGRNGWPKVPGMPSIDNYFLLLSLMHGLPALSLFLLILLSLFARLLRNAFRHTEHIRPGTSLSFTLAGVFAGILLSVATVYMGDNLIPVFFTMVGFGEGYLTAGGDAAAAEQAAVFPRPLFRFQRILA